MPRIDRTRRRARLIALGSACLLAVSGCVVRPATTTPGPSGVPGSPSATPVPTLSPSVTTPPPTTGPGRPAIGLRVVASGFDQPVFVTGAGDGSGRLFVVEQPGLVRIVESGSLLPTPFLDIRDKVSCCGERGLLGLAFAPGFGRSSSAFFVDYTDTNGDTVIASGIAGRGGDPDIADGATVRTILHIPQPFANHNGGMLAFGPDGDLYIGMGDGGSGGDPFDNGQSLDTLLGKILRLDVTSPPDGQDRYVVPATNPFVGRPGDLPEIWAYGIRNPWRFSFDRRTGDLWIGDVGQNRYEEVDVARAADGGGRGLDFGWNRMEAAHCFSGDGCDQGGLTLPVAEYDHNRGDCAVIGGYVYRGAALPGLVGTYLFGDECSGTIRALDASRAGGQSADIVLESHRAISSFGEDEAGEMYLTDLASGDLLQVVAAAP